MEWQGLSSQHRAESVGPGQGDRLHWDAAGSARSQPARRSDGLLAFGEQQSGDLEVTWQLCTSADWQADRLDVRVVGSLPGADGAVGPTVNRTLLLERSGNGWRSRAWTRDAQLSTAGGPDTPGLPGGELDQPIADVVIDSCPLSHWAPVRRLGLAGPRLSGRRGGPVRPLASAYPVLRVRLPDLAVVLTRQRYVAVRENGAERALEHSFAGGPSVPLTVDASGVPVLFDGLARRSDSAMVA